MDFLLPALTACGESFTQMSYVIVDMTKEDRPLVFINRHFTEMTGYNKEEILHKNCRFLQGPETRKESVERLRKSLQNGEASFHDLLNYRKDGTTFWNRLCLFPILHDVLGVRYYVGIQLDVSPMKNQQIQLMGTKDKDPQLLYQEIANPLETIYSQSRALKYFSYDDQKESPARQLIQSIKKQIEQLTKYVAAL